MRLYLLLAASLAVASCKPVTREERIVGINIDSLLNHHAGQLKQRQPGLYKITSINGSIQESELQPASVDWARELESFRALAQINKATDARQYEIKEQRDQESNLMVKTWTAVGVAPVRLVEVYYMKKPFQVRRVRGVVEERSLMFSSDKTLTLEFDILGQNTLRSFEISGREKFIWNDDQQHKIVAEIISK